MDNVLLAGEIELYIDAIKCFDLEDIGNKKWIEWHGCLTKLNQQAIVEASEMREECVKETLVASGKISVLVHEAILISVWKSQILPKMLKYEPEPNTTFSIYSVLYHEATCVALLETVLFHSSSCETLDDTSLDLMDYCCEAATQLLGYTYTAPATTEDTQFELRRQKNDLQFDIGIRAISILRYFAEYLDSLPLSMTSRMLTTLDVPLLLTELITCQPWMRDDENNDTLKYNNGKWQKVTGSKLHQTEAQAWIGLREILLNPRFLTHYELTEFRRSQFMKLQKYLHEAVLDQLSPLVELKHWLCQLSMAKLPNTDKPAILLEVVPQIKERILQKGYNKWKDIAKKQVNLFFKQSRDETVALAQRLSEAYNSDFLEKMENIQVNSCAACSGNAVKKCSQCKTEWYCSRNCQVKHWPQHKEECEKISGAN